jgi:hypothetical protein
LPEASTLPPVSTLRIPFALNQTTPPTLPFHASHVRTPPLLIVTVVYCGTFSTCARLVDALE